MARTVVVLGRTQRWLTGVLLVAAGVWFALQGDMVQAGLLFGAVARSLLPVEKGRPGDSVKVVKRGTAEGQERLRKALADQHDPRKPPPTPELP